MAAVTITTVPGSPPGGTHDPPTTARRRVPSPTCAGASSPLLLGIALGDRDGAGGCRARGFHPRRLPSAARPPSTTRSSRPGRLAVVRRAAPGARRGPPPGGRRARARPATARRSHRARPSSGAGRRRPSHATLIAHGGPALRVGPPWLRRRRDGKAPTWTGSCVYRGAHALSVLRGRRRQGRRLASGRRGRGGAPPPGVPRLRPPLHHLRAGRGAPAGGGEALRGASSPFDAEKLRSGIERAVAGSADRPGGGRRARRRIEEAAAGAGPRGPSECDRPRRARAPAPARPGLVRAVRLGLQGLRRPRRLRARGRGAPEEHGPEGPRAPEGAGRRVVRGSATKPLQSHRCSSMVGRPHH